MHEEYGIDLLQGVPQPASYDAMVLAVAHQQFQDMGAAAIRAFGTDGAVLYDIKSMLPASQVDARL